MQLAIDETKRRFLLHSKGSDFPGSFEVNCYDSE
jgi:hypothetical protein